MARLLLSVVPGLLSSSRAQAGTQVEEPLSHAVRSALSAAVAAAAPPEPLLGAAPEQQAYAQWLAASSQRLARYQNHPTERQEFLQTVWYEARRAGLPLSLVLLSKKKLNQKLLSLGFLPRLQ